MDKALKRQIKEDEFRSGLEHAWEYAKTNRSTVQTAAIAILTAVAVLWGLSSWRSQRAATSEAEFQAALEIFESPVGSANPSAGAVAAYQTAEEKYTKAAAAFDGVAQRFGSAPAGRRARYLAAASRLHLGQTAEARKTLEQIATEPSGGGLETTLAQLALAQSLTSGGELERGIDLYRRLADDAKLPVSRDYVLMELGGALERAGRLEEARAVYKRVIDEFPAGAETAEATRRVESL